MVFKVIKTEKKITTETKSISGMRIESFKNYDKFAIINTEINTARQLEYLKKTVCQRNIIIYNVF